MVVRSVRKQQDDAEDKISSLVVVLVCLLFLGYIGLQYLITQRPNESETRSVTFNPIADIVTTKYNCALHDNDHEACVKAQTSGKGCSWYAGCNKCIVGSHDGKTYEEICDEKKE